MMPEDRAAAPDDLPTPETEPVTAPRNLSPAALRALAEAEERRAALARREAELTRTREVNGRGGKDPVRYSDWEVKGIASDF
jgi:hypothetical protein